MIEISLLRMLLLTAVGLLCSLAGMGMSRALPWSLAARHNHLDLTFGLCLGPFIFSFSTMLALWVLPSAAHWTLFGAAVAIAALVAVLAAILGRLVPAQRPTQDKAQPLSGGEWTLVVSLGLVASGLLFIAIFVPLTQNDSLEYATVGRILYESRSLSSYPVLAPEQNQAGFFGPWTHPPLYVAALFLVEVIQGHASSPGAIRLIAPWFAIAAAGVVYSAGCLNARSTGLAAALIFLSTPLIFLGAASALLDSLFVAAFALIIAAIVGIDAKPFARGLIVGATVGMALWTHSLSVLFVPLALAGLAIHRGLSGIRALVHEWAGVVAASLLLGIWHYLGNVALFGAPISDTPAVFALPSLHWADYFSINRGLNSAAAMLQYGILKGWFAVEAFGLTYWGLTVGFFFAAFGGGAAALASIVKQGTRAVPAPDGVIYLVFGVIAVYFAGAIVSVLIGVDLMVRNERYLLAIQPIVAVGAGFGFVKCVDYFRARGSSVKTFVQLLAFPALALALAFQSITYVRYALARTGLGVASIGTPFSDTLDKTTDYALIKYLRENTPAGSLVLALKPADMYYSNRPMISYLDERLMEFYGRDNVSVAYEDLRRLNIRYVYIPNYGLPPLYNSSLWRVLADPQYSELVFSSAGGQIYALGSDRAKVRRSLDPSSGKWTWTREVVFRLGGRKNIGNLAWTENDLGEAASDLKLPLGLFQRNIVAYVSSARITLPVDDSGDREIVIEIAVSGYGLMSLVVREFGMLRSGLTPIRETSLGSFELSRQQPSRVYARRMRVSAATRQVQVQLEQQGQSLLEIRSAKIVSLEK